MDDLFSFLFSRTGALLVVVAAYLQYHAGQLSALKKRIADIEGRVTR